MRLIVLKKPFSKVIINSIYGKTMENVRKRISVKLVNNEKDYLKHATKKSLIKILLLFMK